MGKIAITMPGKIGDALYILPLAKYLHSLTGKQVDFWTSKYCYPIKELVEFQSYIDKVIIPEDYIPLRFDMGVLPDIQVHGEYDLVVNSAFRYVPDCRLDHFHAKQNGISPKELPPISYELPQRKLDIGDYYVIAPRGETSFKKSFLDFMQLSPIPVIQIGGTGEFLPGVNTLDFTGIDFLLTACIISHSKGFYGLMSSQLALANGFNIPKVAPVNNPCTWDMRHVIYSDTNYYPIEPTGEQVLKIMKGHYV